MGHSENKKRTLREKLSTAFNASQLRVTARSNDSALVHIGAMGAAAMHMHHGADLVGLPVFDVVDVTPQRRDTIAAELAGVLLRLREGRILSQYHRAIELYAQWLASRARFKDTPTLLLTRFARRAILEWMTDRCDTCFGTGKQEQDPAGNWTAPLGTGKRNAVYRECDACTGTGRAHHDMEERAKALGLNPVEYHDQGWQACFRASRGWIEKALIERLLKATAAQLQG